MASSTSMPASTEVKALERAHCEASLGRHRAPALAVRNTKALGEDDLIVVDHGHGQAGDVVGIACRLEVLRQVLQAFLQVIDLLGSHEAGEKCDGEGEQGALCGVHGMDGWVTKALASMVARWHSSPIQIFRV